MPYLTGDDLPSDTINRCIRIPRTQWALIAVDGALLELAERYNWETFGAVTAQQAADRFWLIWEDFLTSMCVPIGTVLAFAGDTPPAHTLLCNGAEYDAADFPDLFATIGYTYGGSGGIFAVPDLRGRVVLGAGNGVGLSDYAVGDRVGEETHQLTISEIAAHNHTTVPHAHGYSSAQPIAPVLAPGEAPVAEPIPLITDLSGVTVNSTGGDMPHENRQPSLALNYIIQAE